MRSADRGFILLFVFLLLQGCSRNSGAGANEQATALIDQGRNADAVQTLSFQMSQNPTPKTRLVLASALAGRNGLYLAGFTDFARVIVAQSRETNANGGVAKLNIQAGLIFTALNSAPTVTTGFADILYAIEILNVPDLPTGGFLYRALLKLVVFKHRFNGQYRLKPTRDCQITPRSLDEWLVNVERDLQEILKDSLLSLVNPDKKAELEATQKKISEINQDIRESLVPELGKPLIKMPFILKLNYLECM